MIDFLKDAVDLINTSSDVMADTCSRIDSITFEGLTINKWLGYAHYVMGTPLYMLFSTVVLISLGLMLWKWTIRGITMLFELLPWK